MVLLIVFAVFLVSPAWIQAKSANSCNDACRSKVYSITRDGLIGCSGANCLMEASFTAKMINGKTVLNINLVGYDFASLKEKTFTVILAKDEVKSKYSCSTNSYGTSDASVTNDGTSYVNGSTQILNNNLYCSWYMIYDSDIWPKFYNSKATFQKDRDLKILFEVDSETFAIASSPVELPVYHMQYLDCCYRVYGSDVYQLIPDQNDKQTDFILQTFNSDTYVISASLADANGKRLIFDCYMSSKSIKGYLKTEALTDEITGQLQSISFIDELQCSWSLPLVIKGSFSNYDTTNAVYELELSADSEIVYTESNVPLKGFGLKTISSFALTVSILMINFLIINL